MYPTMYVWVALLTLSLLPYQWNNGRLLEDDFVRDCSNSIANALELLQSWAKPSIGKFNHNKTKQNTNSQDSIGESIILHLRNLIFLWRWRFNNVCRVTKRKYSTAHMRTVVPEMDIKGNDRQLLPTVYVECNYFSLPLILLLTPHSWYSI